MDENKIRAIIRDELNKYATKNQFGVSKIPAHAHTGVEVSRVDGNDLNFSLPYLKIPLTTTAPTDKVTGITSVSGVLYMYNGTTWVKVGTQT